MGIQGLLPFIESVAVDVHLSAFSGQTAAIDGYWWLHKAARNCPLEMVRGTYTTKFVDYCLKQAFLLRSHGVEPFVVLDGAKLPAKAGTEHERHQRRQVAVAEANELLRNGPRDKAMAKFQSAVNITPEHAYQLICVLRKHGIQYVVAPYEADAQIARLARTGIVSLVLAEDSDMLAFGCPRVLTKMDGAGFGKVLERSALRNALEAGGSSGGSGAALFSPWEEWDGNGVDGGRFLEMCILAGCDYLPSLPGLGVKSAHKMLRKHKTAEKVVMAVRMDARTPAPEGGFDRYLKQLHKAKQTFLHQRVYDVREQRVVPLTLAPPTAKSMPHCGADIDDSIAYRLCAVGDLNPDTHVPLVVHGMPPPPPPPPQPPVGTLPVPPPRQQQVPAPPPQQQQQQQQQQQPQPPPQQLHSQPAPPQSAFAAAAASGAGPSSTHSFTAAAAWPTGGVASVPSSSSSASNSACSSASSAFWAAGGGSSGGGGGHWCASSSLGKRPSSLVQSSLSSFGLGLQSGSFGSGGNGNGGGLGAAAAPTPVVPKPPARPLQSKVESKKPFKVPRRSTDGPPPSAVDAAPSSRDSAAAVSSAAATPLASGGRRAVAGLQRSRFFPRASSSSGVFGGGGGGGGGSSSSSSSSSADAMGGGAAAAVPAAAADDAADAMADVARSDEQTAAALSTVGKFAFTPAAPPSKLCRSPRGMAASGGGSGKRAAVDTARSWEVFGEEPPSKEVDDDDEPAVDSASSTRAVKNGHGGSPLPRLEGGGVDLASFAHRGGASAGAGRHRSGKAKDGKEEEEAKLAGENQPPHHNPVPSPSRGVGGVRSPRAGLLQPPPMLDSGVLDLAAFAHVAPDNNKRRSIEM